DIRSTTRLSKKHSPLSSIRHTIQSRGHSYRTPRPEPPFGSRLTLSDRFYTPTLIRPDNKREGWVMSHKLSWVAATSTAARRERRWSVENFCFVCSNLRACIGDGSHEGCERCNDHGNDQL